MGPDEFERVLRGETPETTDEHALGLFVDDVRGAFPAEPPLSEGAHLAAIMEAAQLLADTGEPATRPASKAHGRAPHVSGLPKRRRLIVKVPLMRSLTAKIVAGAVVLMSMFGGLAFAGALPGQGSDDDATDVVQIQDVSDEAPETEAPETENADHQGENESEDADDQGESESEDADDQGESENDQGDDDQGESENADDQGESENDQGDDDQGESENDQGDDQGKED